MNKKYILFFLFGLLSITISAQSLAEAKALYEKGEYEEAKPTFKKLVKTQPGNGNYNLWYGVCCLETGEPAEALKHLESAVKRRVPSGQLYLARAYNDLYRFEEAIETYETYISDLRKRKRSTEEAEQLLEKSKSNLRMLKGVEEVCFIDSFVVDYSVPQDSFPPTVSECLSLHYDWIVTHTDNSSPAYDTPSLAPTPSNPPHVPDTSDG